MCEVANTSYPELPLRLTSGTILLLLFECVLNNNNIYSLMKLLQTHCAVHVHVMTIKQFTRTQITEDINQQSCSHARRKLIVLLLPPRNEANRGPYGNRTESMKTAGKSVIHYTIPKPLTLNCRKSYIQV